ncbi:MAG: TIGR01212 family radical SAM protein [Candidatus Sumerlaeia bacterium]
MNLKSDLSQKPAFPGGKPWHALGPALREIFGGRTRRIPLDAGFTCPNRDGSIATGGCRYCDAEGARAQFVQPELPVREQWTSGLERSLKRDPRTTRFIAYFQAYTNTYAPPEILRETYGAIAESLPDHLREEAELSAIAIGTRPDCLNEAVLDVLEELAADHYLWIEMGLQSMRNASLEAMNRGHSVEQFIDAAKRLNARKIRWVGHVIFGLPGDSRNDMLASAPLMNELQAWGVKLHNLYIDKHSQLAYDYKHSKIRILDRDEYLDLLVDYLSRLNPEILIHRLMGEAPRDRLIAPAWSLKKSEFLNALEHYMVEKDVWQGKDISNADKS